MGAAYADMGASPPPMSVSESFIIHDYFILPLPDLIPTESLHDPPDHDHDADAVEDLPDGDHDV